MDLYLNNQLSHHYKNHSQIIRIVTEDWMTRIMFCPICGANVLYHYKANKPVADFFCKSCNSDFELKSHESKRGTIKSKIPDGAFHTMIERITSLNNPNLFVMTYTDSTVNNLIFIPKFFFTPDMIEKRQPLKETARRAGWIGCNIEINSIPDTGKIFIIKAGLQQERESVLQQYNKILSLQTQKIEKRGWLLDVLQCIEKLPSRNFCIDDIYAFEPSLKIKHPENNFIRDKIRQQLQYLRNKGFVEFVSRGHYKLLLK